ncbi:MAG: class I SAM-dependent methyltransferase [Candidatus Sulfotelmatobacter sp.]
MASTDRINLWTSTEHVNDYLVRADSIPHRTEGESALLEFIPANTGRVLDLGTGNGRLLAFVKAHLEEAAEAEPRQFVGLDFSPAMLDAIRQRFATDSSVSIVAHNLDEPLPALGKFDAVVSSFAIHHLIHERKRELYAEIYGLLNPGGVFCDLDHVASATPQLHEEFLQQIGKTPETEDPSNKLLDLETQLGWLREIGFVDVDCCWKWRELTLMVGRSARRS